MQRLETVVKEAVPMSTPNKMTSMLNSTVPLIISKFSRGLEYLTALHKYIVCCKDKTGDNKIKINYRHA